MATLMQVASSPMFLRVACEIVINLEATGSCRVDWADYRKRTGIDRSNLIGVLAEMEARGFMCRDTSGNGKVMRWDSLWVNPGVVRNAHAKGAYLISNIKKFQSKRTAWHKAMGGDPVDPAQALLETNEDCMFCLLEEGRKNYQRSQRKSIPDRIREDLANDKGGGAL